MRVQVNLATRPFVELRPFFLRLRLLMAGLGLAGVMLAIGGHLLAARAHRQQLALDRLRTETIAEQQNRLRTENRMRQPANAAVLDRAHFLNALFLRKSFSWTAVMMDLENVLPPGVQVTSIEPQVTPSGTVLIHLRVAGERAAAVQLVRNLERSRRFLQPRLTGEASQTKENSGTAGQAGQALARTGPPAPIGVEFDILAEYNPLPSGQSYPAARSRIASTAAASSTAVPGRSPAQNLRQGYPRYGLQLQPYQGPVHPVSRSLPNGTAPGGAK